jgi:hypothetical protein
MNFTILQHFCFWFKSWVHFISQLGVPGLQHPGPLPDGPSAPLASQQQGRAPLASSTAAPRARGRFEVDDGEHCDGVAGHARTRRYSYSTHAKTRCHKPVARLPKVTASTVMVTADYRLGDEPQTMTEPRIPGTGTRGKGSDGFAGSPRIYLDGRRCRRLAEDGRIDDEGSAK